MGRPIRLIKVKASDNSVCCAVLCRISPSCLGGAGARWSLVVGLSVPFGLWPWGGLNSLFLLIQ